MRVVVKEPGKHPETREVGSDLDSMQAVIAHGRYDMLEVVSDGPEGLDLWANEEGKYAQNDKGEFLEPNVRLWDGQDYVMGTVFVAGHDEEGETVSLTDEEVTRAIVWLTAREISIIEAARARAIAAQFR